MMTVSNTSVHYICMYVCLIVGLVCNVSAEEASWDVYGEDEYLTSVNDTDVSSSLQADDSMNDESADGSLQGTGEQDATRRCTTEKILRGEPASYVGCITNVNGAYRVYNSDEMTAQGCTDFCSHYEAKVDFTQAYACAMQLLYLWPGATVELDETHRMKCAAAFDVCVDFGMFFQSELCTEYNTRCGEVYPALCD